MPDVHVLLRPTRDKKPYRLRCRFAIDAYPWPEWLDREKVKVAERFIADMAKQGWEYVERFGFKMTGPYPVTQTLTLPKHGTNPWHIPSRDLLPAVEAGYRPGRAAFDGGAREVPSLIASEAWEYELAGVFIREQILTEVADLHEELEGRNK